MLETCKRLFSLWNDNNISYCHWKSNEHLNDGLNGQTDLDVFVLPCDKKNAEFYLTQCDYIECQTQKGHRYPWVHEWIGFDLETGCIVHVHLHYQIITGTKYCKEYVFPIDNIIIKSRVKDDNTGVFITDPNLEIIILYCRIALKAINKHRIQLDNNTIREIQYLKEHIDCEKVHSLCGQLLQNNGEDMYDYILSETLSYDKWYIVFKIADNWLKPFRKFSSVRVFFQYHYYDLRNRVISILNIKYNRCIINKKVFPKHHLSICFLGQDGSGKSTVTIELCKWLNWKIDAHRFYLGSGDHYNGILKRIISRTQRLSHNSSRQNSNSTTVNEQDSISNSKVKRKKNIKSFFSAVLVALNNLNTARRAYKEVLRANNYSQKGGISLFDRFPQIQFEGIYDGPKIAYSYKKNGLDFSIIKIMAKIELWYLTKIQQYQPTLVFKLILSPEESMRRKPFEDYDAIVRKHDITNQLQFDKSIVYTIDASQDYQEEVIQIKKQIWETLLKMQ